MMRTSNPALNAETFKGYGRVTFSDEAMTIQGAVNKTAIMLLVLVLAAMWTWKMAFTGNPSLQVWTFGGAIAGFIVALVTVFKKEWAPVTAPLYALMEGFFIGGFSAIFENMFPGIVIQAVVLTFGTMLCLLIAYRSGLIRATENFKLGVVAATGGIALIYLVNFVLGIFGVHIPYIHESGIIGIGFSLFVVVIAALNLVLDFDFIENGAYSGAPKFMEWYSAFGLIVTLIWLYVEILILLSKLRGRE